MTEHYMIQKWHVSSRKGLIPENGCKEGYRLTLEETSEGYHVTWQDRELRDPERSMDLPISMKSQGAKVHFGGADPIPCTVELIRYGNLLMGAFTCGSEEPEKSLGVGDGNGGIFVAEATIGSGDPE